jgi:hypothetical protein
MEKRIRQIFLATEPKKKRLKSRDREIEKMTDQLMEENHTAKPGLN